MLVAAMPGASRAAVAASATPGTPRTEAAASFAEAECPYGEPEGLSEGEDYACGYLEVPEFHGEPDGDTIALLVTILPSTGDDPADEPLVVLAGGPGQGGEVLLPSFVGSGPLSQAALLERQDVILLDQRGTGFSRPALTCPGDLAVVGLPDSATPEAGATPEAEPVAPVVEVPDAEFAANCRDELETAGVDLQAYNTDENAADVNDLRAALGYDQVDLYGISYGSRLALEVLRDFPEAVRGAVLSSPFPPDADQFAGQIVSFDAALREVFARCGDDPDCAEANPDLEQAFSDAVASLGERPIDLTVQNPLNGESVDVSVDGDLFIQTIYLSVFIGLLLPVVPALITSVVAGETTVLETVLPIVVASSGGISTGMFLSVTCQDEVPFTTAEQTEQTIAAADVLPDLADGEFSGGLDIYALCEEWGVEPAPDEQAEAVESEVPTLILTGEFDPITPPAYGELAAETLPNSFVVELPGLGHDPASLGGDCPLSIVTAFLADPEAEPDTACAADLEVDFSP